MYFNRFPKIRYNVNGNELSFVDISRMVKVNKSRSIPDTYTDYLLYTIPDGVRPDILSHMLYGKPDYYWTFFAINEQLKENLYYDWPLSYQKFERMIESEYDRYSAITFKPIYDIVGEYNNKTYAPNSRNIFENAVLDEKYLPYLQIVAKNSNTSFDYNSSLVAPVDGNLYAKIAKYDSRMCQLIVYDIRNPNNGDRLVEDRTAFTHKSAFYLKFVNPHKFATIDYYKVYDIETEWLYKSYILYRDDCLVIDDLISNRLDTYSIAIAKEIEEVLEFRNDVKNIRDYFRDETITDRFFYSTNFTGDSPETSNYAYAWENYRYAAHQYYDTDEYGNEYEISTLDQLHPDKTSDSLSRFPKYYSNYDYEYSLNEKKSQIKTIRPDKIREFVEIYMSEITQ
jgi:hypothetical protein